MNSVDPNNPYNLFPSPLGVIFSLIRLNLYKNNENKVEGFRLLSELYSLLFIIDVLNLFNLILFPSPLGVIFSLIK